MWDGSWRWEENDVSKVGKLCKVGKLSRTRRATGVEVKQISKLSSVFRIGLVSIVTRIGICR